jgi:hypothetical protein
MFVTRKKTNKKTQQQQNNALPMKTSYSVHKRIRFISLCIIHFRPELHEGQNQQLGKELLIVKERHHTPYKIK